VSEPNPTILPATVHNHKCSTCGFEWACADDECNSNYNQDGCVWCNNDCRPRNTKEVCTWTEDSVGDWDTSCGNVFTLGRPEEVGMEYCPFCDEEIKENPI